MSEYIIIPARLGSTRLPRKMVKNICGLPLIVRTYMSAMEAGIADVVVACDSEEIEKEITAVGGRAILTDPDLPSGTDRVCAAAMQLNLQDDDVIINLQGDHPCIKKEFLHAPLTLIQNENVDIATPMTLVDQQSAFKDNIVKIATTFYTEKYAHAHYFSRARIPFNGPFYQHVGVYVYALKTLRKFVSFPQSSLEKSEKLEQLRALQHDMKIDTVLVNETPPISVDTAEDLENATSFVKKISKFAILPLLSICLTSCAPLLICSGAGLAGVSLRNREGISGTVNDNAIHAKVLKKLSDAKLFSKIEVVVKHKRVLLIGYVKTLEQKQAAIDIVKSIKQVEEVIDEIKIGYTQSLENATKDSWITSRIKGSMAADGNIHCLNFNVTTYDCTVYILGLAESKVELDSIVNIARSTSHVSKVVTYINIINN